MKRNLCDGLGMAEEGAKGSITQSEALPVAASPGWSRLPSRVPRLLGNDTSARLCLSPLPRPVCTECPCSSTYLAPRWGGTGALLPGHPGRMLSSCTGLVRGCLAGESFLAQVKRETFSRSP